jgi:hypothetical protein
MRRISQQMQAGPGRRRYHGLVVDRLMPNTQPDPVGVTALLRYLWAAPSTAIGLGLSVLAFPKGRIAVFEGVIEAHGPLLRWVLTRVAPPPGGIAAITLGHVVLACDRRALEQTRSHERVHVRQYERWGPFFLPAYAAASLWALARGRHPYVDNWFEREARRRRAP